LITSLQKQSKHIERYLPSLDLSALRLKELLQHAKNSEGNTDALLKELTKVALTLNRNAKAAVLGKIRSAKEASVAAPTDRESYSSRRQLILSYDFFERAAGRRPIYPRKLGRPFVTLVETPSLRDLRSCDGFLEFLSKIPIPPPLDRFHSGGGGGGLGGSSGEAEDPGASSSLGGGFSSSGSSSEPSPGGTRRGYSESSTPPSNRGWEMVRWYVLGTLFALFSIYLAYLAYTAAKGGRSILEYLRRLLQRKKGGQDLGEDPFRKGIKLFGQAKYHKAIAQFEPLTERALQTTQPARYYLILAALRIGKEGLVKTHIPLLDREKFSPDELYRLALGLEENGNFDAAALEIHRDLALKDSSFRDVAKRAEKLDARLSIPSK
jgi:hypothetical protein